MAQMIPMVIAVTAFAVAPVHGQVSLEVRGGLNVPTFSITDAAKAGPSFGVGLSFGLGERVSIMGDADFGYHNGADLSTGGSGPDVDVSHFIAKVGYKAATGSNGRLSLVLNAGVGAMRFAVAGGGSFTYPAINVGAKIAYQMAKGVSLVLSPQGDIAFGKRAEIGTTNAWVWPFAVGLRFGF
jgi:hypothetical protein